MTKWYLSKTFWVNIIAAMGLFTGSQFGYTITPEIVATLLCGINMILRAITKEPIDWS